MKRTREPFLAMRKLTNFMEFCYIMIHVKLITLMKLSGLEINDRYDKDINNLLLLDFQKLWTLPSCQVFRISHVILMGIC